jgi:hypothetical protein
MEKAHMLGLERSSRSVAAFDEEPWEDVTSAAVLVEDDDNPVVDVVNAPYFGDEEPTLPFRRPRTVNPIVRIAPWPARTAERLVGPPLAVRVVKTQNVCVTRSAVRGLRAGRP